MGDYLKHNLFSYMIEIYHNRCHSHMSDLGGFRSGISNTGCPLDESKELQNILFATF